MFVDSPQREIEREKCDVRQTSGIDLTRWGKIGLAMVSLRRADAAVPSGPD